MKDHSDVDGYADRTIRASEYAGPGSSPRLAQSAADAGHHGDGGSDADAWGRREHCGLQRRARHFVAPVARLAAIFAVSALLLASVGIYGVLAYTVASRTKETGVRMAMGATRRNVLGLVVREGMIWAGSGILVGLIGAFAAARLIATLLFDIPARDPVTFATVGGAMALVALTACSIPAARAVRIDPTTAMRTE